MPSLVITDSNQRPLTKNGHSQVGMPLHGWVPMLQKTLTAQSIPPDLNLLGQSFPQQHGARRRQIWVPFRHVKLQCGFGVTFPDGFSDTLPGKDEIALLKFRREISRKISRDRSRENFAPQFRLQNSPPKIRLQIRLQNSSPKFVSKTRLQNSFP